ncbi:MAG: holin [Clostridiales bacterium]|nr:holin [Clostridiales bacterium]
MQELFSSFTDKAVALIHALAVIGRIIRSVPAVPRWLIPVVLLVPGVLGTMALLGWSVGSAILGVLITGAAVYGNQIWKKAVIKSGLKKPKTKR